MPVYIVLAPESRRVKIGFTAGTMAKRLAKMQTDNHERLQVIRWLEGGEDQEAALHQRYADKRLRGDWFEYCETMAGDLGLADIERPSIQPITEPFRSVADITKRAGGVSRLARHLGLSHTTILAWRSVPPKHVPAIAALLDTERHFIRPDLWEPLHVAPPAKAEAA